jgi:hypothetical protein
VSQFQHLPVPTGVERAMDTGTFDQTVEVDSIQMMPQGFDAPELA